MRVLHVLPSLDQRSGGPLRAVLNLSLLAQAHGLASEVIGVGEVDVPDNPLEESSIHACRIEWPESYSYSSHLRGWLQANVKRFDGIVLHGMWLYPNLVASQECIRAGVPYACFPHGMLEPWAISGQGCLKCLKKVVYWRLFEKKLFDDAEGALFATKRECLLAKTVAPLPRLSVILPPFAVDRTVEMVGNAPSDLILKATASRYVLFLGRIHPKKNLTFLIKAWAQARVQEGWRLVVAGPADKKHLAELKRLVEFLKVDQHVTFLNFVSGNDKAYLLQNAKWLLLPSRQENFGLVVLEALQNGCPVAISDQVFLADELKNATVILRLQLDDWIGFFGGTMLDDSYRLKCVERCRELLFCNYSIHIVSRMWVIALTALFCQRRVS